MGRSINIIDATLREGEQSPGLLFSLNEKKSIVDGLAKIGITEVEVGIASELQADPAPIIKYCRTNNPQLQLSLWSRCKKEDIAFAAECGPDIISLSIPVSDIHLTDRLQKSRKWAKATMIDCIKYARKHNMAVSVGFEDATRSDPAFLISMAQAAEQHGATRIRIADTVGIASPGVITKLIKKLKKNLNGCSIGIHAHNDFGMATANNIAAIDAGASSVDVVALGLGERTGCARLEEVVGYLALARNNTSLHPEHLKPLATYVAGIAKRVISPTRPVIGEGIFTCETGLHLQGLQRNPKSYEPFNPERVQAKRKLLYGSKSGKNALLFRCNQLSSTTIDDLGASVVRRVRQTAENLRRPLNDEELRQLLTT